MDVRDGRRATSTPEWSNTFLTGTGFPFLAAFAAGFEQEQAALSFGIYAQDQWTLDRLTLNLGLRWDDTDASYPDQVRPTNIYFDEPFAVEGATVVSWQDIQPRIGVAYDLFGDGRTALKASVNRYGKKQSNDWSERANPVIANRQVTRDWFDG